MNRGLCLVCNQQLPNLIKRSYCSGDCKKVAMRDYQAQFRIKHRERLRAYRRKRWADKHEELLAQNKSYRENAEWKAKQKAYDKMYRENLPDLVRRARILTNCRNKRYGKRVTAGDLESMLLRQLRKCNICKISLDSKWHMDHIVPLSIGGRADMSNFQILCAPCNLGKGTMLMYDYIAHCRRVVESSREVRTQAMTDCQ